MSEYNIKVIIDAYKVINLIASNDSLTLTEISVKLNINKTRLFRILSTLVNLALIEQVDMNYFLGWKLFELGQKVLPSRGFKTNTHQIIEKLRNIVSETVNLGILVNDKVLFIDISESNHNLNASFKVGTLLPSHLTSLGKAILSTWDSKEVIDLYLNRPFERFTPNSISDVQSLIIQLNDFNKKGWAIDDEEYSEGIRCIAVPIKNHENKAIAALSISGPTSRMTMDKITIYVSHLLEVGKEISTVIGGSSFK